MINWQTSWPPPDEVPILVTVSDVFAPRSYVLSGKWCETDRVFYGDAVTAVNGLDITAWAREEPYRGGKDE